MMPRKSLREQRPHDPVDAEIERPIVDADQEAEGLIDWEEPTNVDKGTPGTVGDVYDRTTTCTASGLPAINLQLTESQICAFGDNFRPVNTSAISFGPNGFNLFTPETAAALERAADQGSFGIISAFRSIAWQYLLTKACSIVATPGRSNHQGGRAVDVANFSQSLVNQLETAGMTWPNLANDRSHFNGPGADRRSDSVKAFQLLWNLNHPDDPVIVDGVWGPQTRARMRETPVAGFPQDLCSTIDPPPLVADTFDTIGRVDSISPTGLVQGWSCDPDQPDASNSVKVYLGDGSERTLIGDATADEVSEDAVAEACGGGSAHRFSFQITQSDCMQTVHVLGINLAGTDDVDSELSGSGVSVPCFGEYSPVGVHESVDANGVVEGWVCDPDIPDEAIEVLVYAGGPVGVGTLVGTTFANLPSDRVAICNCGGSNHNFRFELTSSAMGQSIYIEAVNAPWTLGDNTLLNRRSRAR